MVLRCSSLLFSRMMPSPPKKVHLRKRLRPSLLFVLPWMVDRSCESEMERSSGYVNLTVGPYSVSTPYGRGSTSIRLASSLASLLNGSGSPVTATVSGATISLTSIAQGTSANYALSYSSDGDFNVNFSGATMTGGSSSAPAPGGLNQQYTLDAWGNLSSRGSTGFTQPINAQNQVSSFSYDAGGRLLNDSVTSYSYDDEGMLVQSSDGASYVYDAVGACAQVARGGTSKEYYYFAGQLIATLDPSQGAAGWTDFINAGGQKIAVVAGTQTATPVYTLPDHLGTEVGSVDSNGTLKGALDYTPFGQMISGSSTDNFIFTSLEHDASGLDHAGFRMYSSTTARWTTPDPYDGSYQPEDPQSLNRYAYTGNNPLAFTDPLGLQQGTHGDGAYDHGGCGTSCDIGILIATAGISELVDYLQAPQFTGNVEAQNQGKFIRTRLTNGNPNAPNDPTSGG